MQNFHDLPAERRVGRTLVCIKQLLELLLHQAMLSFVLLQARIAVRFEQALFASEMPECMINQYAEDAADCAFVRPGLLGVVDMIDEARDDDVVRVRDVDPRSSHPSR